MIYLICGIVGFLIGFKYRNEKIKNMQRLIDFHDAYFKAILDDENNDFMDEFDSLIEED